jgi:hypothetical protein
MSAKLIFPSALILAVVSCCAAGAQTPPGGPNAPDLLAPGSVPAADSAPGARPAAGTPAGPTPPTGLSSWLTYARPDCCGPIGGNGPIKDELYVRSGASLPVGGDIFGHVLTTGWEIQGGARTLFFDPDRRRAWTADASVSSIWNNGQHGDRVFPLHLLVQTGATNPATGNPQVFHADLQGQLRSMNRTAVNLAFGREWFLLGSAASCGCGERSWRVGIDAGGSYGSAAVMMNIDTIPGVPAVANDGTLTTVHLLRRRSSVFGSAFVGLHSDLEVPMGCCIYYAGFRAEWGYTWSSILQAQNPGDIMDVNLLMEVGVRF